MSIAVIGAGIDDAVSTAHDVGELIGTIAFATSGALLAVRRNLDIVGIVLLAVATALGGGIVRDVLIGNTPPNAFTTPAFIGAAGLTGIVVFFWHPPARLTRWPLEISDAIGLGLFVVTGTVIADSWGLGAPTAALLGVVTGVGGGVIRDVLSGQVPAVLRSDEPLYAIPAFCGGAITAGLLHADLYRDWVGLVCAALVVIFRIAALHFRWHGPRPRYVRAGN